MSKEMTTSEKAFQKITEDMLKTYIAKNHDYGDSFKKSLDEFGPIAAVVRMGDKMERIKNLLHHHTEPKVNEKIEDTLKDLANYCIMTLIYLQKIS